MRTPRRTGAGRLPSKPPPELIIGRTRRWALLALSLIGLSLEGCQQVGNLNPFRRDPCKTCGLGGLGGLGGLLHRNKGMGGMVGEPPIYSEGIVEEGTVGEIITEPATSSGTTIIRTPAPQGSTPSGGGALELDPLPDASSSRQPLDARKIGQVVRSRPASEGLAANVPANAPSRERPTPLSVQIIDDLPRPAEQVSAAAGVTDAAATVVATESPPADATPPEPIPASTPPAEVAPAAMPVDVSMTPAIPIEVPSEAAPGLRSFAPVEPQVAGGSFPSEAGFQYLAEKGYRTLLDLRDPAQIKPEDVARSHHWGLRHVLLPVVPDAFGEELVRRFEQELGAGEARPVYFCDADGSRAAALWYVHRVQVDKVEPAMARRDAESLGRIDPSLFDRAELLLKPSEIHAAPTAPEPVSAPLTEAPPAADAPVTAEVSPNTDAPASATVVAAAVEPEPAILVAETDQVETIEPAPSDPGAWRPYAAMFLSVLGVPIAYWGCATLSVSRRQRTRASLPAPERRTRSLPPGSDA